MFIYNNNHILSGYIKQFLSSFNLPTCRIYSGKFDKYFEEHGVEHPHLLESFDKFSHGASSIEEAPEYLTKRVNYLRGGTLQKYLYDPTTRKGFWKPCADGFYYTDKYHRGLTKRLKSEGSIYDSKTHEYLGEYLRYLRDAKGINLMSMYNCFSNVTCQNLQVNIPLGTKRVPNSGYNLEGVAVHTAGCSITSEANEYLEGSGAYKINNSSAEKLLATFKEPIDLTHGMSTNEESDILASSSLHLCINGNFSNSRDVILENEDGTSKAISTVSPSMEIILGSYVHPITFLVTDMDTGVWQAEEGSDGAYIIPIHCPELPIDAVLPDSTEIPIMLDSENSTATVLFDGSSIYLRLDTLRKQLSKNSVIIVEAGTVIHKYTLANTLCLDIGPDSVQNYIDEVVVKCLPTEPNKTTGTVEATDLVHLTIKYPQVDRSFTFPVGTVLGGYPLGADFTINTFADGATELDAEGTPVGLTHLDFETLGDESHFTNPYNNGELEITRVGSEQSYIPPTFGAKCLRIKYLSTYNYPTFRINFDRLLPKGTIISFDAIAICQADGDGSTNLSLGIRGYEDSYTTLITDSVVHRLSFVLQADCAYIDLELVQGPVESNMQIGETSLLLDNFDFDSPLGALSLSSGCCFIEESSEWDIVLRVNKKILIAETSELVLEPISKVVEAVRRADKTNRVLSIKVDGNQLQTGWNILNISLDESGTDTSVVVDNNNFNPAALDWIQISTPGLTGDVLIDDISVRYIGPKDPVYDENTIITRGSPIWSCDQLSYTEKPLSTTINTLDHDFIVYMLPVKLFEKYTIAVDSAEGAEIFCALYNHKLVNSSKNNDLIIRTYKKYNRLVFNNPILYDRLSADYWNADLDFGSNDTLGYIFNSDKASRYDIVARERDLKLFIKLPKACNSTITVLEGDYRRFNDCLFNNGVDNSTTNMNINLINTTLDEAIRRDAKAGSNSRLRYRHNKAVLNFETSHSLDSRITALPAHASKLPPLNDREFVPISRLQLLALNSGVSHPFADRLIEYLLNWAITPEDEISDNISRAQAVMRKNSYRFIADGVWEPKMQMLIYDYIMNDGPVSVFSDGTLNGSRLINQHKGQHVAQGHYRLDNQYDILGYVDRTAERLYSSWYMSSVLLPTGKEKMEAKIQDTIETIDIYDNRYGNK